jgi:hypothetical protein
VLGLTAVIGKNAPETDEDVAHSLMTLVGWAAALWRMVFVAALVLMLIIVIDVLVQRLLALRAVDFIQTEGRLGLLSRSF